MPIYKYFEHLISSHLPIHPNIIQQLPTTFAHHALSTCAFLHSSKNYNKKVTQGGIEPQASCEYKLELGYVIIEYNWEFIPLDYLGVK